MDDDVWGNAWSQPDNEQDLAHSVQPSKHITTPSWSLPAVAAEEADVGTPSWSTGGLNWTEPTGEASLWASSNTESKTIETSEWDTSTGYKFDLSSADPAPETARNHATPTNEVKEEFVITLEPADRSQSATPTPTSPVTSPSTDVEPPSASIVPTDVTLPDTEDQDPFGSFEAGFSSLPASSFDDDGSNAWVSTAPEFNDSIVETDGWGPKWEAVRHTDDNDVVVKDEWTIAREEKARRDRTVPPEMMESIYENLDKLSSDLWPDKERPKFENFGNWRNGLKNIDGLDELLHKVIPETPTQPPLVFSGSNTARSMGKCLKLTKNLPIVRNSPMSHLFLAKNLAAWELSIKNAIEKPKDDIPPGWKTIDPITEEHTPKPAAAEKKSGGFLSFLGRRSTGTPPQPSTPTQSDTKSSPPSLNSKDASPVASNTTTVLGSGGSNHTGLSANNKNSSSISSLSSVVPPSPSGSTFSAKSPSVSSISASSSAQNQPQERSVTPAASAGPSVVSRFFNRFSRVKSETPSSPRNSIALSTDEIDFLSDIVPSHSDDMDQDGQLDALTALVSSPPIASKLPPPLAPPPLAPPPRPESRTLMSTSQPNRSLSPTPISETSCNTGQHSILAGLTLPDRTPSETSIPALPPPLPPPISPTISSPLSKPPCPSPKEPRFVVAPSKSRTFNASNSSSLGSIRSINSLSSEVHQQNSSKPSHEPDIIPSSELLTVQSQIVIPQSSLTTVTSNNQSSTTLRGQISVSTTGSDPPPPIDKSPNRVYALSKTAPTSYNDDNDDDEFSDFQSHEMSGPSQNRPSDQTLSQSYSLFTDTNFGEFSDQSLFPKSSSPQTNNESFGDFGDFMSIPHTASGSLKPSEHVPSPTSPPPTGVLPPLPKKQVPMPIKTEHIRKLSSADHEATAQLVERAAAHQGRWPAPLTPVPEPLSPPPTLSNRKKPLFELDDDEPLANGITFSKMVAPLPKPSLTLKPVTQMSSTVTSVMSKPYDSANTSSLAKLKLAPPPSSRSGSRIGIRPEPEPVAPLLDLGVDENFPLSVTQPSVPPKSTQQSSELTSITRPSNGGLSAQDLSFFEGL